MRYDETLEQADRIASVSSGMMAGTAIYTLLLGIGFVWFGLQVHKRWVTFWGGTMVLAGTAYLVAIVSGAG